MTNDLMFYFKDMQPLIGQKPAYIMVNSNLEMQNIAGRDVIIVQVEMQGFDANNQLLFRTKGCPCPPCKPAGSISVGRLTPTQPQTPTGH